MRTHPCEGDTCQTTTIAGTHRRLLIDDFGADIVFAARHIRRSPAFALLAFSCLGLGIRINTRSSA